MMSEYDIFLITAPSPNPGTLFAYEQISTPPLGLGYLATFLKSDNYLVKIIDMALRRNNMETILRFLENNSSRIVGISCTTETYNTAIRISSEIKSIYKDSIIILGGPHVSFEFEAALKNDSVDYIILNEGEISLKKLCDYLIRNIGALETLKGVAYKKNGIVICAEPEPFIKNLDLLPFPDRTLFEHIHDYKNPATLSTSRGCPGQCIFCAASVLSGGRYRMRSVQSVISEVEYLKFLGFHHIDFVDDTMTVSISRLNSFLDELISRNLKITWTCESRVDSMSKDILLKMKVAGLKGIQFGVESGNQDILDSIKKNITLKQVQDAFKWCNELSIYVYSNLIIGQPFDTIKTIEETIQLAEELMQLGAFVTISVCTPFPGTPIWNNTEIYGIEITESNLDYYNTHNPVLNTKHLSATEIGNIQYKVVKQLDKLKKRIKKDSAISADVQGIRIRNPLESSLEK